MEQWKVRNSSLKDLESNLNELEMQSFTIFSIISLTASTVLIIYKEKVKVVFN